MPKWYNHTALAILRRQGFRQDSFKLSNSPVYYLVGGPEDGPRISILPGYSDTIFSWGIILAKLAAQGYRVFALDPPGYMGFSPRPRQKTKMVFRDQERVAEMFLCEVTGRSDYIMGNSLGGWMGFRLAIKHPERIGHLIAINPGGIFTTAEEYLRIRKFYAIESYSDYMALMRRLWGRIPLYFHLFSALGVYRFTRQPQYGDVLRSIGRSHFLNKHLSKINLPVSVIWGQKDQLFGEHMAKKFIELLPNAKYFPVRNAGHMPHLESPYTFFQIMDEILEKSAKQESAWLKFAFERSQD
ncbi:MAG: alpha/beta hydrolase [Bdellovibrionota bacterium]